VVLARALVTRDARGSGYSERLAAWVEAVAQVLGCREDEVRDFRRGALLHGIGKVCAPVTVLQKPMRLTAEERAMMRQEPVVAEKILQPVEGMQRVASILRHHREKWDGSGYPDKLKANATPVGARILAVVEAYLELITGRPGAPKLYYMDAEATLKRGAGTQFDPRVVAAFCAVLQRERGHVR